MRNISTLLYDFYLDITKILSNIINKKYDFFLPYTDNLISKTILKNNQCIFNNNSLYKKSEIGKDKKVYILYIINAKGNKECIFFDYLNILDEPTFVVFLDPVLENINLKPIKNEYDNKAYEMLGRSNLFSILSEIAKIFNSIYDDQSIYHNKLLSSTSVSYRIAISNLLFAACIIYDIFGKFNKNDLDDNLISLYNDINKIICSDNEFIKQLGFLGILDSGIK